MAVTAANVRPLTGAVMRDFDAGAAVDMGAGVYVAADGDAEETDANTAASSELTGVCVAVRTEGATAAAAGERITVVTYGPVGGFSDLTPGALQYVSETPGAITETAPTGAGTWTKIAGYAEAADILFVNPGMSKATSNS